MPNYHLTYYYLASGMEGYADEHDYGVVEAPSHKMAMEKLASDKYPNDLRAQEFFVGCLTAKEVQ